jgi:hypothetical protein
MSSIDKLALTCRVLYDERVLEQRKEIEKLQMKLFFRDYTGVNFQTILKVMNWHVRCKCNDCRYKERIFYEDTADEEAACTFGPWLDNVLHERGLVVLRQDRLNHEVCDGPVEKPFLPCSLFEQAVPFIDADCHLVELIDMDSFLRGQTFTRWDKIGIGKRLWTAESIHNPWIKQFSRVFTPLNALLEPLS